MPGSLVSLNVEVGDEVVEGQEVAVLEAMKVSPPRRPSVPCASYCCVVACLTALLVRMADAQRDPRRALWHCEERRRDRGRHAAGRGHYAGV